MAEGVEHQVVLKIGFLCFNEAASLEAYKQSFDVVVLDDGPMDPVLDILKEIANGI